MRNGHEWPPWTMPLTLVSPHRQKQHGPRDSEHRSNREPASLHLQQARLLRIRVMPRDHQRMDLSCRRRPLYNIRQPNPHALPSSPDPRIIDAYRASEYQARHCPYQRYSYTKRTPSRPHAHSTPQPPPLQPPCSSMHSADGGKQRFRWVGIPCCPCDTANTAASAHHLHTNHHGVVISNPPEFSLYRGGDS